MAKNCAKMTGQTKKTFIYLYLARKSFKNQENIKRKREAANILQKREGWNLRSLFQGQF